MYRYWQKVSVICSIGSIGVGEYPDIGIGGSLDIGAVISIFVYKWCGTAKSIANVKNYSISEEPNTNMA